VTIFEKTFFLGGYGKIGTRAFDFFEIDLSSSSMPSSISSSTSIRDTITEIKGRIPLSLSSLNCSGLLGYLGGEYFYEEQFLENYRSSLSSLEEYGPLLGLSFTFFSEEVTLRLWIEGTILYYYQNPQPVITASFGISYTP